MRLDNGFKFYISDADIMKAAGSKSKAMKVMGIASTNDRDSDGEMLDVNGMDLSGLKWINWNHKGSEDAGAVIGEITKAQILNNKSLYVEGTLFPEVDMATHVYKLMKGLKRSERGNKLSWSVEGNVVERDPFDKLKVIKSEITSIALCPTPVNGNTWADLLEKGYTKTSLKDKAMTVEENQHITKESVEGEVDTEEDKDKNKKSSIKKMTKSQELSSIYEYLYSLNDKTHHSVISATHKIIKSMNPEGPITDEQIEKAMKILDLAKSKHEDIENHDFEKAKKMCKSFIEEEGYEGEEMEEGGDAMKKAASFLKGAGYDEDTAHKAYKAVVQSMGVSSKTQGGDSSKINKSNDSSPLERIAKSITTFHSQTQERSSRLEKLIKSQNDTIKGQGEKLEKFTEIIEGQQKLMKSQETFITEMQERLGKIEKTSKPQKSIVKSFGNRFNNEDGIQDRGGQKTYSLSDKDSRRELINDLSNRSGLSKGKIVDQDLANIASEIEISKSLSPDSLKRIEREGIGVIK